MVQPHVYSRVGRLDPIGDALREKHGTMLSASTSKGDHQVAEMPLQVIVDALSDNAFHMLQKDMCLGLFRQVFHHFPVATRLGLELRFTSRIGQGTAVEHKATAIATKIVRIALLEGEAIHCYGEGGVRSEE